MRYFELVTLCFVDYNVKVFLVNHFTSVKVHGLPTPAVNIYMNISKYEVCVHQLIRGFTPNVFNVYLKQCIDFVHHSLVYHHLVAKEQQQTQ